MENYTIDRYDVHSFPKEYCQGEVARIVTAVANHASLLVIGMPGCGKSRLIDFIFTHPDILQNKLPSPLKSAQVDGDALTTNPLDMYTRLLKALNPQARARAKDTVDSLKEQLIAEVGNLTVNTNLVIIFDNFTPELQASLEAGFFNFLYALRNLRPGLNLSYLFMTNLRINRFGFYKAQRLFDQGIDQAICWVSCLKEADAFFSIERQWHKANQAPPVPQAAYKKRIYEWSGGHALLNRYLSHLALQGDTFLNSSPKIMLQQTSILTTCQAIWEDLDQVQKNLLIDVSNGRSPTNPSVLHLLQNYGILTSPTHLFSPIFAEFVQSQQKGSEIASILCADDLSRILVQTADGHKSTYPLHQLSSRKKKLLCHLLQNNGEICLRGDLVRVGWPNEKTDDYQALYRQIEDLKRWLEKQPFHHYLTIETQYGTGYKLDLKD